MKKKNGLLFNLYNYGPASVMNIKAILVLIATFIAMVCPAQTIDWAMKANPVLNSVNGVAFNASGQKAISGTNCHPASIRVFDVNTGNLDWDFTVGENFMCIMGVTFSSNTQYIAAIEEFGNIFIFDNTGTAPVIIDTINTGTSYGFSTIISPTNDKVAVGCSNGKLKVYNLPGGTLAYEVTAHSSWVTTVAYSSNGNYVVTGGSDNKVKIWDNAGTLLFTCTGHTDDISGVKISPDNNFVISSSKDNSIKIWEIATGALVRTFTGHTNNVNGIDIAPDGSKIVSASSDSTCKIWDFYTGNVLATFGVPDSGEVNTVAWSPIGDKIITGNVNSDVILWSIPLSLGITSKENDFKIVLFPNPANNYINFTLPTNTVLARVDIIDSNGKLIQSSLLNEKQIPIDKLSNGIYHLAVLTTQGKRAAHTFVINR
jgi:WD40 repeat protein